MKRRDDNRQLRPEEVDALEDNESEEAGIFSRASEEVLAQRKIVKPKNFRTSLDSSNKDTKTSFNSFGSLSSNPFAGFTGLSKSNEIKTPNINSIPTTPGNIINNTPKVDKPIITQPPANFSLGFSSKPLSTATATTTTNIIPTTPIAPSFSTSSLSSISKSSILTTPSSTSVSVSAPKSKIEKLNKTFEAWLSKQLIDHPISDWSGGLQDYIKYAKAIAEESPAIETVPKVEEKKKDATFSFQAKTESNFGAPSSLSSNSNSLNSTLKSSESTQPLSTGFSFGSKPTTTLAPTTSITTPASNSFTNSFVGGTNTFKGFNTNPLPSTNTFGNNFLKPKQGNDTNNEDDDGNAGGGDDELVPLDEPEIILRNDKDTDEILYEVSCKLFRFIKNRNEWSECGKGTFRVTSDPSTNKKRILVRNTVGKITLNTNFFKGMNIKKSGKNGIQFIAPDETRSFLSYLVKVKDAEVEKTYEFIHKIETSL